ncbi:ATP-binding Cassette (ABC) Superfamily, partial [Thraustotheca clavata]
MDYLSRAPVQVRIYTQPRKVRTPFDNYVCAPSEVVCSDIFWSALLGDMLRLRHLVVIEGIAIDITSDPWMMHQTPLHWAAKGGSLQAIELLLSHGANVYTKDDTGSIPLHLACYAGHTQAAIELLKAGDLKDLLIADYDANLNSLEWAAVRGHSKCVKELTKYTDTVWLPLFIEELIWKIILKTKMKSPEEKAQEVKLAAQRAEYQRLQALAEQAKQAAQFGEAILLDRSDAAKVDFSCFCFSSLHACVALSILFMLACMYRKYTLLRPEYDIKRVDRPCLLIKYVLAVAQVFLCIAFFTLSSMEHRTTTASQDIGLTSQGIAWGFYASILLDNGESIVIRFMLVLRAFCLCHQFYILPVNVTSNEGFCEGIIHYITIIFGLIALLPDSSHYNGIGSPYDQSSLISRLLYLWISPFVSLGKQRRFEIPDIPPLPRADSTFSASHGFQRALLYERRKPKPSFLRLLRKLYGWEILGFGLWSAFNKLVALASPFLIREFLEWAQSPQPTRGYMLAIAICAQALVSSLSGSQYGLAWSRFDLRLRAGLMAAIYSRTLELSLAEKTKYGMGKLTNYISVDLGRLIGMPGSIFDMILIPTEIALALYLLGHEVSYAFVAGLIVLGIMLPIQTWLGKTLQEVTKAMLQYRDDRVEWSSMTIKGVRVLKLLGWLEHYLNKMREARTLEMQRLRVRKYLDALCVVFWASTPVIVQSSVFLTVIYSGRDLTAANAFTAIALLDRLIYPMNYFPWIINGFLEARVSALRIRDFLFPEKSARNPKEIMDGPFVWHECIFSWQKDNDSDDLSAPLLPNEASASFTIQLHHFELEKSNHVYVVGSVGSGKTSFLLALLGDMPLRNGRRCFPPESKISYAPQVPWLFPTSVRRNITLAESDDVVDMELYNRVLAATCLTTDLNNHSKSDLTEVGDGGKNFSGGQCLRIGLARALYQRADLYLLDDCLSGLDKTTAALVMSNLESVLPAHATLVLATHAINLLPNEAKTILVLDKGQIIEFGSYSELSSNEKSNFRGMLHYHDKANTPATTSDSQELIDATTSKDNDNSNEEHREDGVVDAKIWWKYFASMGWYVVFSLFVAVVFMQGTRNGLDLWVANYASHHDISAHTFANGLLILTGCNIIAVSFRSFLFAYGGLRAANALYAKLIYRLFHATFAFFDRTPLGRLLNRLSGDTYGVDESLPFILNILIKDAADITGTFVILMLSNPYVIVTMVPLGVVYFRLQNLYRPTSRHLRRLDSVAQSPLVMHFHATLEG